MTPMPLSAALQKHFPDGGVTLSTMQNAIRPGMELWDISGLTGTSLKTIEKTYGHQDADYQRAAAKAFIRKRA